MCLCLLFACVFAWFGCFIIVMLCDIHSCISFGVVCDDVLLYVSLCVRACGFVCVVMCVGLCVCVCVCRASVCFWLCMFVFVC